MHQFMNQIVRPGFWMGLALIFAIKCIRTDPAKSVT